MKLFDRDEDKDEVRLKSSPDRGSDDSKLEKEAKDRLTDSGADSSGSQDYSGGSSLPGMSGSGSGSSASVDMQDLHDQNKKIIGLLEDIKSEVGGGSSTDELL